MKTDATDRAMSLWSAGKRWDDVLETLRDEGYTKIDAVRASVEILRLPLADAKPLVHGSRVWRDVRAADEHLHDKLVATIRAEVDAPQPR
jgi:hypothetical protein